ncbi:MAG: N-acetylmuramoyl-L-alanine amidase [Chitinivibrionales bacterium]
MVSPKKCYLDTENKFIIGEQTLGALVGRQGKKHLWESRSGDAIDTIVIHHISAVVDHPDDPFNLAYVLLLFCRFGGSSHYLIDRQGEIYELVPEREKAWHCGPSIMPAPDSRRGVNDFSIGIELMGTMQLPYTDRQYHSLAALCRHIETRRGAMRYVGHETVAGQRAVSLGFRKIAKTDPGPLFDWNRFERMRKCLS